MAINNEVNITLTAKDKASSKFKWVEKSASWLWSKLKNLWWPLKAIWIWLWAAWVAAWAVWIKMFNLADSIETTVWKAQTVFWEYFDDMDKFAKETWKAMWLSRAEFLKTAAGIQDLLIPMWFTREEATKNTQELIWLSWALAEWSAWQYDAAQVWDILAKAMLWEREQLKSLWIAISEEDVKQRLLINGTNELTWAALQQARAIATQQLIFEKSTDAQAAFAEWADSLTRKKAELKATLWNVQETIATALLPAFHEIVTSIQPIIEKVAENITLWFQNKENVEKLTAVIKTIIWVFWVLFQIIWKIIWFLTKMWEMLWFVAFKVVQFVSTTSNKIVELWENIVWVWNWIKESTLSIFNSIKEIVLWVIESITSKFTAAFEKIKAIVDKIKSFGSAIWWAVSSAASNVANTVTWARANWWDVSAWKAYMVWERGSELFVPKTDWTIVPNSWIWWNISINMWGVTVTNEADENRLANKIKQELTETLQMYKFWIS